MSRSYKHNGWLTGYSPARREWKRIAAKAVRNFKGKVPKGSWYKRLRCSYDIKDYVLPARDGYKDWIK